MWYKTSGRKPYYRLGASMRKFFAEPIRFIKESITVESEMEKPYLEENYNNMHLKFPDYNWSFSFSSLVGGFGGEAFGDVLECAEANQVPDCWMSVDSDGTVSGEIIQTSNGQWFKGFSQFIADTDQITGNFGVVGSLDGKFDIGGTVLASEGCEVGSQICVKYVTGTAYCEGFGFPMTDPEGEERECCTFAPCPDECIGIEELSWDDNNPLTVARSNSVELAVLNGSGPFNWSLSGSGTGFSLTDSQTVGRTNYLSADSSACGSITVTVTDACEGSADGVVKCTTGVWCSEGACSRLNHSEKSYSDELFSDGFWYTATFCYSYSQSNCLWHCGGDSDGCPTPIEPEPAYNEQWNVFCRCIGSETKEWKCSC